jgi:monoamine oxidase
MCCCVRVVAVGYFSPGAQSQPETWEAYANQLKAPNLWVAGADYQVGMGNGYMEGAIRHGYSAAEAITATAAGAASGTTST